MFKHMFMTIDVHLGEDESNPIEVFISGLANIVFWTCESGTDNEIFSLIKDLLFRYFRWPILFFRTVLTHLAFIIFKFQFEVVYSISWHQSKGKYVLRKFWLNALDKKMLMRKIIIENVIAWALRKGDPDQDRLNHQLQRSLLRREGEKDWALKAARTREDQSQKTNGRKSKNKNKVLCTVLSKHFLKKINLQRRWSTYLWTQGFLRTDVIIKISFHAKRKYRTQPSVEGWRRRSYSEETCGNDRKLYYIWSKGVSHRRLYLWMQVSKGFWRWNFIFE